MRRSCSRMARVLDAIAATQPGIARRAAGGLAVGLMALLVSCSGSPESASSTPTSTAEDRADEAAPGDIPSASPSWDHGDGGSAPGGVDGDGDTGGHGNAGGGGDSGADGDSGAEGETGSDGETGGDNNGNGVPEDGGTSDETEPVIEVAGPTLESDYSEYWGNIYREMRSGCANFTNSQPYDFTVESVSISRPLVLVTDCSAGAGQVPGCGSGTVLTASSGSECRLGFVFAAGTDFSQNYLPTTTWTLRASCTDAAVEPCSADQVAAAQPSLSDPVSVRWSWTDPMRFCGATDYADENGNPGEGSAPTNGCTVETSSGTSTGPQSTDDPSEQQSLSSDP
jgi:hypothetical protein